MQSSGFFLSSFNNLKSTLSKQLEIYLCHNLLLRLMLESKISLEWLQVSDTFIKTPLEVGLGSANCKETWNDLNGANFKAGHSERTTTLF